MAHGTELTVIAALAVGIAFVILFAMAMPAISTSTRSNSGIESGTTMSASYFLNDCNLPSSSRAASDVIKEIKDRNWIAVAKVDRNLGIGTGLKAPCTIVTPELASKIPSLATAIKGADGCIAGTEVCQVSYGISRGGDEADYELTITKEEAANILKEVRFGQYNTAMLASGDSFYMMWFYSLEEGVPRGAQIETRFLEPFTPDIPVSLAAGQSISYTVLVKTWATYGGPAKIDLVAAASATDSGLLVKIEPATLEIPERSEAKAVLKITVTSDVRDGIYEIFVGGRINDDGLISSGPCDYGSCRITVGNSSWHISTFGSDTSMGQGGPGEIPDWLSLDFETDKGDYSIGEPIEIRAYVINEGSESMILDRESRRLITMIYGPAEDGGGSVYGIDSYDFDATDPIIIEPHSKTLLVRSFMWDQKTMEWGVEPHQVPEGTYMITMSFSGYSNAVLNAHHWITISPTDFVN
jgi:hypothetical protein